MLPFDLRHFEVKHVSHIGSQTRPELSEIFNVEKVHQSPFRTSFPPYQVGEICLYRMKLHSSNLVCTWILGCSCPRTTNWPPSGRGLGNVSNLEIWGPPQYLSVGWSHASQIWCAHGAWAVLARGPQIGQRLYPTSSVYQQSRSQGLLLRELAVFFRSGGRNHR